jgi:RND family efflux transporter MFP subunit
MSSDEKNLTPEGEARTGTEPVPESATKGPEKRHRGCGLMFLMLVILAIAVGEAVYIFRDRIAAFSKPSATAPASTERKILYWQDPMHPQYKSDKPGKAPDCGMDLVPVYAESGVAKPVAPADRKVLYWQDPMNPSHRSDRPGKAPDGMDLVPVYAEGGEAAQNLPEGTIKITPEKQQLIGVQYGEVTLRPLSKTIRAVARLAYDETRITRVHSKIAGWIEHVYVDFTGQLVRKGQPLLSVYSPDLVATQDEYLLALKARDKLGSSPFTDVAAGAGSLLDAARRRLELWDLTDEQIAELEKTRKPAKAITLYSTADGFVIARNAYERQRIMPETELYSMADLSTIWAIADIYEFEAPLVRVGQAVSMTLASFPGRIFRGKITYIYPQLDDATRTLKVRAEFSNPGFALKPDMYANVELRVDFGKKLAVPREAVLDSGSEQLVFVAREGGYFEPRKVQLGDNVDNQFIVLSGLKAGERVVTSGNFLVDSESKLKSAVNGMGMPGMDHGEGAAPKSEPGSAGTATPQAPSQDRSAGQQGGKAPQRALPMDHSQHQKGAQQPRKEEPIDHSKHQMKPEQHSHD